MQLATFCPHNLRLSSIYINGGQFQFIANNVAGTNVSIKDAWATNGNFTNGWRAGDFAAFELNDVPVVQGVPGTLAAGTYGFGMTDGKAFQTVYVRLADGANPNSKADGFVYCIN